jgi:integrase
MVREAPAQATRDAYDRWIRHFRTWCETHGRCPLPATEATFVEYVRHLARDEGKGAPTIRIAVAAVRAEHATRGFNDQPPLKLAMMALRTHTREQVDAGGRGKKATPILLDELRAMLATCSDDTYVGRRDRLILVLGWAAMLRRSELAALLYRDVTIAGAGVDVFIARSKTDKAAKGATVHVPAGSAPDTDVVRNLTAYRHAAAGHGITGGRLLRGIRRNGQPDEVITGDQINDIIRRAARAADLPGADGYSAHSLRSGGATAAYLSGTPVADIAAHGRWAPNSPVVLGYIRAADRWRNNAMKKVGCDQGSAARGHARATYQQRVWLLLSGWRRPRGRRCPVPALPGRLRAGRGVGRALLRRPTSGREVGSRPRTHVRRRARHRGRRHLRPEGTHSPNDLASRPLTSANDV